MNKPHEYADQHTACTACVTFRSNLRSTHDLRIKGRWLPVATVLVLHSLKLQFQCCVVLASILLGLVVFFFSFRPGCCARGSAPIPSDGTTLRETLEMGLWQQMLDVLGVSSKKVRDQEAEMRLIFAFFVDLTER